MILLDVEKVIFSPEYINYTNVYLPNFAKELFEYNSINNYLINLVDNKLLSYHLIYSLKPHRAGGICLENLHYYRSLADNQAGKTFQCKEICNNDPKKK